MVVLRCRGRHGYLPLRIHVGLTHTFLEKDMIVTEESNAEGTTGAGICLTGGTRLSRCPLVASRAGLGVAATIGTYSFDATNFFVVGTPARGSGEQDRMI